MGAGGQLMARLKITLTDGTEEVRQLGAFAQIAAKRRFGLEALRSEDPEPVLFAFMVETEGPKSSADPDRFDEWLQTVATFELLPEDATADPPMAESGAASPDSPPTSD